MLYCTVSVTVVVRESDPDVAVTVIVEVPAGVPEVPPPPVDPRPPPVHPAKAAKVKPAPISKDALTLPDSIRRDFTTRVASPRAK